MGISIAMLAPKKGVSSDEEEAPTEKPKASMGGSAKRLAMLAVQAIKDGDDEAAADALVGMAKACGSSSYSEEP
jgi:hypothetical protein